MTKNSEIIVGIDIGSSKVVVLVAKTSDKGLYIIGIGSSSISGVKNGILVDSENTLEAVNRAIKQAELISGYKIHNVYINFSGTHVISYNCSGMYTLKNQPITEKDINEAINIAKAEKILESDRLPMYIAKTGFVMDGTKVTKDPIGVPVTRLESKIHLITAKKSYIDSIVDCLESTGLVVDELVFNGMASANAVLFEEEKEVGVALLDIGAGNTDIAIYNEGKIVYSSSLEFGGNVLTKDLSVCLSIPFNKAEELKIASGSAVSRSIPREEQITIPVFGTNGCQNIRKHILSEIIDARLEEEFKKISNELKRSGHHRCLSSGIVVTGGASLMKGFADFAQSYWNVPVRVAAPMGVGGLRDIVSNPMYSTVVGSILTVLMDGDSERTFNYSPRATGKIGSLIKKAKHYYNRLSEEYF